MARPLFTLLSAVSLVLCVATCILWGRSYWVTDQIRWKNVGGWRAVRSATGHVEVGLLLADWSDGPPE
jgi:hypothetical protein